MNSSHITAKGTTPPRLLSQRENQNTNWNFVPVWWMALAQEAHVEAVSLETMRCAALLWLPCESAPVVLELSQISERLKLIHLKLILQKQLKIATQKLSRFWDILSRWHGLILNLYNLPSKFWNLFRTSFKLSLRIFLNYSLQSG